MPKLDGTCLSQSWEVLLCLEDSTTLSRRYGKRRMDELCGEVFCLLPIYYGVLLNMRAETFRFAYLLFFVVVAFALSSMELVCGASLLSFVFGCCVLLCGCTVVVVVQLILALDIII